MEKSVDIKIGEIIYEDTGMITFILKEDAEIEIEDIKETHSAFTDLTKGKPFCIFTDARCNTTATTEARAYASKHNIKTNLAVAILVHSTAMKLMANFYIQFNKPIVPTKMFTKKDAAIKLAKSFLEKENNKRTPHQESLSNKLKR